MNFKKSYNFLFSVLRDEGLTSTEKIVYSLMLDCAEAEGGEVTVRDFREYDILAITAMPIKTVERAVQTLQEKQYISINNDEKNAKKSVKITHNVQIAEIAENQSFNTNSDDNLTQIKDILSKILVKIEENGASECSKNEKKTRVSRTKKTENEAKNDTKSEQKDGNDNQEIDDFVERIYKLYPTFCPMRNNPLGKCSRDKARIRKLLKDYSQRDIERVVRNEVDTKFGKSYMQNFSTFLNNFPDPALIDGGKNVSGVESVESKKVIINGVEYR